MDQSIQPLFVVIISIILVALIIYNSIIKEQVQRSRIMLAFVNIFIWLILCIVYDSYIDEPTANAFIFVYAIIIYLLFALVLYLTLKTSILRTHHYQLFIDSIKNTKFNIFLVVDQKERIKDISPNLLVELGLKRDDVLGKRIFDIYDKTIRFTKFNDSEVNNRNIREFYRTYKINTPRGTQEKREISFQNCQGDKVTINIVEQPVYVFNRYRGRISIGEKKNDASLMNVEKELVNKNYELESIRYKFIATLELTEEALFFMDLDRKHLWGTDTYKQIMGFLSNDAKLEDFNNGIHQDDVFNYLKEIQGLTPGNPNYQITYRYKRKNGYVWIKEIGKRIFEDENSNVILGFTKLVETNSFEKTGNKNLDSVKNEIELMNDLDLLFAKNRPFEVVLIKLDNIPLLNEKHSRSVGNMMMEEYIRKIKQTFSSENSGIYRISGLEFVATITDVRKMDMLKKVVEQDTDSLSLTLDYGGINDKVTVKVGIAIAGQDAYDTKGLIACAKKALKVASHPNYERDCCYYKDIR